jgi:hypothetical protein
LGRVRLRLGSSPQECGGAVPIVGQQNRKAATEGAPKARNRPSGGRPLQAAFIPPSQRRDQQEKSAARSQSNLRGWITLATADGS